MKQVQKQLKQQSFCMWTGKLVTRAESFPCSFCQERAEEKSLKERETQPWFCNWRRGQLQRDQTDCIAQVGKFKLSSYLLWQPLDCPRFIQTEDETSTVLLGTWKLMVTISPSFCLRGPESLLLSNDLLQDVAPVCCDQAAQDVRSDGSQPAHCFQIMCLRISGCNICLEIQQP